MKGSLLALLLVFSVTLTAGDLPKAAYGKFSGEMEAYTIVKNDMEMEIAEHEITVSLKEDKVRYYSGNLELSGEYEVSKENKTEYLITTTITNGKSLTYELEIRWDKKKDTLLVHGKNGQPDVLLKRI